MKTTRKNQQQAHTIHWAYQYGQYKVYDAQGKFRCSFVSQEKAEAYIERLKAPPQPVLIPEITTEAQQ